MKQLNFLLVFALLFSFACGGGSTSAESTSTEEAEVSEETEATEEMAAPIDIVTLAAETETLSTLVAAVTAGGLVETLKGDGPFTVFAPTNEAFAALPEGVLDDLLKPENKDQLVSILTYHVVAGKVMSTDLQNGMNAETVNGASLTVDLTDGVKINEANVTAADIEASNGVVHVIDQVILPPTE